LTSQLNRIISLAATKGNSCRSPSNQVKAFNLKTDLQNEEPETSFVDYADLQLQHPSFCGVSFNQKWPGNTQTKKHLINHSNEQFWYLQLGPDKDTFLQNCLYLAFTVLLLFCHRATLVTSKPDIFVFVMLFYNKPYFA